MSDFRAIAGVSASLRTLLRDRMELPMNMNALPPISIGTPIVPPPQTPETIEPESPRVNIFLFQVNESPFLKNRDLPGQGSGMAYGKPPLSLELHFLLTAYGSQVIGETAVDETAAQFLLGSAMRVLHDYPVIHKQLQTVREPVGQQILHESLRKANEQVKLSLHPMTLEDLTKIWTALTLPYRLSVAYSVSLVQIESQTSRSYPRLVGEAPGGGPGIVAIPLDRPAIESLQVVRLGESVLRTAPYARVGDSLVLVGRNFNRATEVEINGLRLAVTPQSSTRIQVTVPDTTIDGETIPVELRLQPGAQPVEVLSRIDNVANFRLRSNRSHFMLVPLVSAIHTAAPRTVTIVGKQLYHLDGSMQALIGYALFAGDSYASANSTQITMTLPDVLPHRSAAVYVGSPVTNLEDIHQSPEIMVTINGAGPHTLTFSLQPNSLQAAAVELQNCLRSVASEHQVFIGARVALLDNRLVIVPGGGAGTVTITPSDNNNGASILGLISGSNRAGYLSGMLRPFPTLSNSTPAVQIAMDGQIFTASLGGTAKSIGEIAGLLEAALQAGPTAAFAGTRVMVVDEQLLILTGQDQAIIFTTSATDETTLGELHLRRNYSVRVRVNGAESIGGINSVELPI